MADIFTRTTYYLYALKKKMIDESSDTIRMLCMRTGFAFDKFTHKRLINIRTNTGAISLVWAASDDSVSRASGSFITDGFVAGNRCTSNDTLNPGPFTIDTVTASKIIFNEAVVDSTATKTLSSDDELATASGGYTQNSKSIGVVTVGPEDDTYDRCDSVFPTVSIPAVSANIGPTPGVIFYDVTADVIIGYLQFGTGEITKVPPDALNVGGGTFRLG